MTLADDDFVDGDLLQLRHSRAGETLPQRRGLDLLDGVPTHLQVPCDGPDGHVTGEFEGVAFEDAGGEPSR